MPPGHLERPWTGPAAIGGHNAAVGAWCHDLEREPPLAELLADPIMELLWRADDIDADAVRAELRVLQARLRRLPPPEPRSNAARDLAA